ncbi:MAG: Gfo/Idh/MocA family oxidoreductase [Lachnospiraceae bacterium]|uniref:Gfo/Idh/MocA family oxidoreductase n=1 Tax=Parablautia intestinalis TaxID=2320100 RepID=UPI0023D339CD|nr:Gfo/Idh/MocA family oxidoreductase [Parablautia intestinalis]MCI8615573.1 Gfo/Idh/MocA family oxidoreductase [Lachnospiraceae bacterium]MDE7048059.1 Gfo/Idh/MocA family oxidoreductase [Lachnospiraceae bacterium]
MKEIRLGTVGSDRTVQHILDKVKETPGIKLEAIYSKDAGKGHELAAAYGCNKVYTDMDWFLGDEEINTLYFAASAHPDYEQVKDALLDGRNVILENSSCISPVQTKELLETAEESHLFLVMQYEGQDLVSLNANIECESA